MKPSAQTMQHGDRGYTGNGSDAKGGDTYSRDERKSTAGRFSELPASSITEGPGGPAAERRDPSGEQGMDRSGDVENRRAHNTKGSSTVATGLKPGRSETQKGGGETPMRPRKKLRTLTLTEHKEEVKQ